MEEPLTALLLELATDPGKLSEYLKDRESYPALTRVSPEARDAILTGDQEKVAKLVGMALGSHTSAMTLGKQLHDKHKKKKNKKKKNKKKASRKAAGKPNKA